MTHKEAADILDPVKQESALLKYDSFERLGKLKEACQIAAEMLRNTTGIKPDCNQPLTLEQLREMEGRPVYNCMVQQWFVIEKIFIKGKLVGSQCDYAEITMSDGTVFCSDLDYDEISGRFYPYPPAHIDRDAWDDCPVCGKYKEISFRGFRTKKEAMDLSGKVHPHITGGAMFCPKCGKPRNERAWADLEQRLGR